MSCKCQCHDNKDAIPEALAPAGPVGYTSSSDSMGPRRAFTTEIGTWDGPVYWRDGRDRYGFGWCIDLVPLPGVGSTMWVVCRATRLGAALIGTRFGIARNIETAHREATRVVERA